MKIWYQSVTREGGFPAYVEILKRLLDRVKEPDTEIEVHGIRRQGGTGDQYRYLAFLETIEILENVHRAVDEGFDAFLIGNIGDPGLREAREIAPFPVLGLGEASQYVAATMGESLGLVTINEKYAPRLMDTLKRAGLHERLAGMYPMNVPDLAQLEAACREPVARQAIVDRFLAGADAAAADGAEVILAAGGVVMVLIAEAGVVAARDGTPVLNGVAALVKQGEAAVKLARLQGGRYTSKRLTYATPKPGPELDGLRKAYGVDVYRPS